MTIVLLTSFRIFQIYLCDEIVVTRNIMMSTLEARLSAPEAAAIAKHSSQELSAYLETKEETQLVTVTDAEGIAHSVDIPVAALRLLVNVLSELGQGSTVKIVPINAELTTQEGADLLNISRPTFIKLLDEQHIPFSQTGNRRKVRYADVKNYQDYIKTKRLATLGTLSALDQELEMG